MGSRRNADIVNESEVPQSPKLPSVSEVAEQPTTEHHPPTPSSTAQSEVPIETQASSPAAEHSVQSMSATLEKKNNVVHLSEKPPMSNSASKSVSDKADTMSDISEDNSSINSSRRYLSSVSFFVYCFTCPSVPQLSENPKGGDF